MIEVPSGYFYKPRYVLNFELTDYYKLTSISFNQDDIDQYFTPNGVTITNGPNILMADDISQTYEFGYEVSTSSGPRYIIDKYYR